MIIGIDTASDLRQYGSATATKAAKLFIAAYVAFLVTPDGQWKHYCDHHAVKGNTFDVFRETAADGGTETETATSGTSATSVNAATIASLKIRAFLESAVKHFQVMPENIVVARGSVPDGEVDIVRKTELDVINQWNVDTNAGKAKISYLAAQKRTQTRFFFDVKKHVPGSQFADGTLVNVPRGFHTTEGLSAVKISDKAAQVYPGFFLVTANCSLGHSKPVRMYKLQEGVKDLEQLFYALAFLFPNKPDAIPYPLPLKCAEKYANQFILLELDRFRSLPEGLKPRMHYL